MPNRKIVGKRAPRRRATGGRNGRNIRKRGPQKSLDMRVVSVNIIGDTTTYSTAVGGGLSAVHLISPNQLSSFSSYGALFRQFKVNSITIFTTPMGAFNGITYAQSDYTSNTPLTLGTAQSGTSNTFSNNSANVPQRFSAGLRVSAYVIRNPFPKNMINASGSFFTWSYFSNAPDVYWKLYTDSTLGSPISTVLWQVRVEYHLNFREQIS